MGTLILDMVVDLLNEGGLRAEAAQPAGDMTAVQGVVAAVSLERVDQADESVTVMVEMVGPVKLGARECQKTALEALEILRSAGGVCQMGKCTFISKADIFCIPVTAVFYGTASPQEWQPRRGYTVTMAGADLQHVTGFSAGQKAEEGITLADAPWEFTLEEFLPVGAQEPEDPAENFALAVSYGSEAEHYIGCKLTARQRVAEKNGIRQIRRGMAEQRTPN